MHYSGTSRSAIGIASDGGASSIHPTRPVYYTVSEVVGPRYRRRLSGGCRALRGVYLCMRSGRRTEPGPRQPRSPRRPSSPGKDALGRNSTDKAGIPGTTMEGTTPILGMSARFGGGGAVLPVCVRRASAWSSLRASQSSELLGFLRSCSFTDRTRVYVRIKPHPSPASSSCRDRSSVGVLVWGAPADFKCDRITFYFIAVKQTIRSQFHVEQRKIGKRACGRPIRVVSVIVDRCYYSNLAPFYNLN